MEKVYNLGEAEDFFIVNNSDNVVCVKDGDEKEIECYQEAKEFFK